MHACFMPMYLDRRECLIGLNCNTRINNIEGSNHNNNAIACNNNNLNANHSYSLFHLMCARVHVHYARVRVRRAYGGIRGAALYMNYS